jgi:hypothetical protein
MLYLEMEHSNQNENVTIIENEFVKFFPINFLWRGTFSRSFKEKSEFMNKN